VPASVPRSRGTLLLHSKVQAGSGASVLEDLRHSGCLKALFPRGPADRLSAVFVNTSGGITGGDDLRLALRVGAESRLSLTSQAAERIYRASGGEPGRVTTRIEVAAGAQLDWLPQETILFDAARLDRRLRVDLAADARCLVVETLVFGRTAMGEDVRQVHLSDRIEIWRAGAPLFIDRMRLSGDAVARLSGPATAGGAVAMASVIFACPPDSPDAAAHLESLRPDLPAGAGASLIRPGLLFLRLAAPDSFTLRRTLLPVLAQLNDGPLPRTWMI
jgi:urease accessory protein